MPSLPTGTVTFLYTDIEGSTTRWERNAPAMKAAVERHDTILRDAIESRRGRVFRTMGDAFCAVFLTASDALEAALDAQSALQAEDWQAYFGDPESGLRVRMALHSGVGEVRDGDYIGPHLNRVARLLSTGYGGQVLLSQASYQLIRESPAPGLDIRDLGEHRLKDLQRPERVYQASRAGLPAQFPPLKTLDNRPNNLPVQRDPLIGRETEVAAIGRLLLRSNTGLLTLTGPGGTGKTRLALQAGADLIDSFEDGVYFVGLASITDPELVPSAIAQPLGVREAPGQSILQSLKEFLSGKHILLILDNFEQVVAAGEVVAALLTSAPHLKIMVTSREVLRVYGERDFPVPPLSLPDRLSLPPAEQLSQYDAVRLFIERAQAVRPDFAVTNENAPAVAEICYRLDGLPLAIELAAARVAILSPQAMLARLQSRLKLLTGGARDLPARQQTLRGAIAWSYDLLNEDERKLFRRLAVFVNGFTLDAAETVCTGELETGPGRQAEGGDHVEPLEVEILDCIGSLSAKSLLRQVEETGEHGAGETRFKVLDTIREYGLERLMESGELDALRRRHAGYFLAVAEAQEDALVGPLAMSVTRLLSRDLDNLRAALAWSLETGERDVAVRLTGALGFYWDWAELFTEGRRWCDEVLTRFTPDDGTPAYARLLSAGGMMAFLQGDLQAARPRLERSAAIWRDRGERFQVGAILHGLGMTAWQQGDRATARAYLEESIALSREGKKRWALGIALFSLGDTLMALGVDDEARSRYRESIAVLTAEGDTLGSTLPLNGLGRLSWLTGDYDGARSTIEQGLAVRRAGGYSYYIAISLASLAEVARCQMRYEESVACSEEALALYRQLGELSGVAWCYYNMGYVAYYLADYSRAASLLKESLLARIDQRYQEGIALGLSALACLAARTEQWEHAARLFGAADLRLERLDARLSPADRGDYDEARNLARERLDQGRWLQLSGEGSTMSPEELCEGARLGL